LRKAIGVTAAGFGGLVLLGAGGMSYAYASTSVPTDASQAAMQQQSTVYFSDGKTVIGTFGSTNRQLLTYSQIPAVMRDATLAAEDRSFYTEGGVSPTGIMRAAYEDVFHGGGSSGSLAGGSTITQEFVRGYYSNIGTQQTVSRKVKEIFVALKVAKEKSKAWILTQYLNTIYLGQGAYGIGAAAQTYFGEPASKLTVAQAAMIAAIIQSPSYYPTPAGHQALVSRWHYVLNGLVKMGDLTPAQAAAQKFPQANSAEQQHVGADPYDPYVLEVVRNELEAVYHYTPAQIDNGGLRIVTTLSKGKMDALYRAVNQNEKLMSQGGMGLPSYAHVGAVVQNPQTGAIVAMYPGPGQNMSARNCQLYKCDLNTAIYTREQVGSSFKPYVLATAVQQGMNVQTSTLNGYSPLWIPPDSEASAYGSTTPMPAPYYKVTNDSSDGSQGPVTVQKATAMSLNTAYTDLIHKVGTRNVVTLAQQMGVDTSASGLQGDIGHVGMALGQDSLSVDEQATMLSTLDDNGTFHSAHVIQQITQGTTVYPAKVVTRQVLTAAQDSQVQYAMSADTIAGGTATAAAMSDGRPIIGKTGTTNDAQSAFFIGAIPQYAMAVGIFSNDQTGDNKESLNGLGGSQVSGGFGGYWPARIWHSFAESQFAQLPVQQFQTPQFSGESWNMLGQALTPKPTPSQTRQSQPTTSPTAPATTNPTAQGGFNPNPDPSMTVEPTCDPFAGNCPNGNGTGNGNGNGNGSGNGPGNGAAGFVVALVPMRWLLARRRRRRS
jgi:membrane peptidoglycan carboxypeptidase